MKVVSLVPSITETLIECGIQVIGRTRFCIHPKEVVQVVPSVGGTKNINQNHLKELDPDLVIFDKSENRLEDYEAYQGEKIAVDITCFSEASREFYRLSRLMSCPPLEQIALRWQRVDDQKEVGVKERHLKYMSEHGYSSFKGKSYIYLIWKEPYMAAGGGTFISSVMEYLGLNNFFEKRKGYFELDPKEYLVNSPIYLASSEPYSFKPEDLNGLSQALLVDGEKFSWYGVRSLRFLEGFGKTIG